MKIPEIKRTKEEIDEQVNRAHETAEDSRYFGMTFEQGVIAAIEWILGETDELPMEDEI